MTAPGKHIALICNPTRENDKALRIADQVSILLTQKKIRHASFIAEWPLLPGDFTEAWIMGGDGTLNHFINAYPDIHLPLTIFSGGSGNDFHWMLYGELPVDQQVELVLNTAPRDVDAGICNGRLFLNGLGIGFDGAIVKDLLGRKKLSGKASYLLSILKHIINYHEKPCALEMQGEIISQDCFLISVANGSRYGGGFHVTPKASLTDGLLDINIVGRITPFKRIRYLPVIEKGEHLDLPFVQYRQVKTIRISAPVKLHAHIDGEYLFDSVFETTVLPEKFSFLY
ncbi:MAG: diacylglycerol/lipid kinase family protein [Flavisolibacter sp.]